MTDKSRRMLVSCKRYTVWVPDSSSFCLVFPSPLVVRDKHLFLPLLLLVSSLPFIGWRERKSCSRVSLLLHRLSLYDRNASCAEVWKSEQGKEENQGESVFGSCCLFSFYHGFLNTLVFKFSHSLPSGFFSTPKTIGIKDEQISLLGVTIPQSMDCRVHWLQVSSASVYGANGGSWCSQADNSWWK